MGRKGVKRDPSMARVYRDGSVHLEHSFWFPNLSLLRNRCLPAFKVQLDDNLFVVVFVGLHPGLFASPLNCQSGNI